MATGQNVLEERGSIQVLLTVNALNGSAESNEVVLAAFVVHLLAVSP